ncbi:MAG TPA: tetratricopeptide repeat protein, partial [Thermoanaerobaculia bacterium]
TSSFALKDSALDTREIGRRMRVATLLESSVRRSGDRLRVTAQLVDVDSGFNIWSDRYDRELRDVFAVQDEIANSIARALRSRLGAVGGATPRKLPTADLEAYDYYLRGRKYYFQYNRRGMQFAQEMFGHAVELDPAYARAHAGIANCCAYLYIYADRCEANREWAEAASRRALALDPTLAEAHVSCGVALSAAGRNEEAEAAFEEALRLDPQLFEASYFYARHAFARGDLEKAARLYERAEAVRPEDYQAPLLLPEVYVGLGRPREAEASRRRGLAQAEERLRLSPDDVRARYMGANALVALGDREKGLEWTRAARLLDPDDPMLLYNIGCIHSLAGETGEALDCLERAVAAGLTQRGWFLHDTDLDPLRGEARFHALLERLS